MKPLSEVFTCIQKIIDNLDGGFSIKNSERKYLFVNDKWLASRKLKRENVIGKTVDEVLSPDYLIVAGKTDKEALEKRTPLQYTNDIILNGKPFSYFAIKWVVACEDTLFLCTIADSLKNKEKILAFSNDIDACFEKAFVSV